MIPEWAQLVIGLGLLAMVVTALVTLLRAMDQDSR